MSEQFLFWWFPAQLACSLTIGYGKVPWVWPIGSWVRSEDAILFSRLYRSHRWNFTSSLLWSLVSLQHSSTYLICYHYLGNEGSLAWRCFYSCQCRFPWETLGTCPTQRASAREIWWFPLFCADCLRCFSCLSLCCSLTWLFARANLFSLQFRLAFEFAPLSFVNSFLLIFWSAYSFLGIFVEGCLIFKSSFCSLIWGYRLIILS